MSRRKKVDPYASPIDLRGDHNTKRHIAERLSTFAKALREEAASVSTMPTRTDMLEDRHHEFYEEAARKSYAAAILDSVAQRLGTEAKLMRYPKLKCQFCGGDAHACYPRHLEGKSCD